MICAFLISSANESYNESMKQAYERIDKGIDIDFHNGMLYGMSFMMNVIQAILLNLDMEEKSDDSSD